MFKLKILDESVLSNAGILFEDFINYDSNFVKKVDEVSENSNTKKHLSKDELNNDNIIRNISFDESEILFNIMKLHNNGEPFECDMTASELKFYNGRKKGSKYSIPEPSILFDVMPKEEKIKKIEPLGQLPLEDNSISSLVIDLPFVVSGKSKEKKDGSMLIFSRFHGYYPVDSLYQSYFHWISQAFRVLKEDGICVFKTQSTISGGISHNTEEWSFMAAQRVGFTVEDKFILNSKARLISAGKYIEQKHARKYTSIFYVFKKTLKKKSKNFNYFDLIEKYKEEEDNRYINFEN